MRQLLLCLAVVAMAMTASTVQAAVVGGFNGADTRANADYSIVDGVNYTNLRDATIDAGHSISGLTGAFTAGYLNSVDVFITGLLRLDNDPITLSSAEQTALTAWVSAGGTLFVTGDNANFDSNTNTFLNLFGLNLNSTSSSGGTWSTVADPLLAGIVPGSSLSFTGGGTPITGSGLTALASDSAGAIVASLVFGNGRVIATGDANMFQTDAQSIQFALNVFGSSTGVTPVPLPAALPLLAGGMICLGLFARRRNRAAG